MLDLRSAGAILTALLYFFHAPLFLESQSLSPGVGEAPAELLSTELGDSEVSLTLTGSWKGTVSSSWGIALTPLGIQATGGDGGPLLFVQETDLTLSLWIEDRWFVEASFLDDYNLNTYRAGYRGLEGDTVRYVGVGNTGLDFPSFPYLDLGGDTPNSFGVYGKFGSGALGLHALVRYDGAVFSERVFLGGREQNFTDLPAAAHIRGRFFVLPDAALNAPPVVYLEDPAGTLSGSDGRRWRRATLGEYSASAILGLVELTSAPRGRLAVSYSKGANFAPWGTSLGSYGDAENPGTLFLGEVQAAFTEVNLGDLPQPGNASGPVPRLPATIDIDGTPALVLYEGGTFSSFEVRSRYEAPFPSVQGAALVRASTGARIPGYLLEPLMIQTPVNDSGLRETFDLFVQGYGADRRSVQARWPLISMAPELYLPGTAPSSQDISLRFISFGLPGAYDIGTDVVPGSVRAYRDGFLDPSASYDGGTGLVTFADPVASGERIRIRYLRRSEGSRFGSLSAGIGAVYEDASPLNAALGLGFRWNLSPEAFSSDGATHPGTVGVGGRVDWKEDNLALQASFGVAYEQADTTNLYRASGMEGSELDLEWRVERAFPSEEPRSIWNAPSLPFNPSSASRAPLVYRDYRSTDLLGTTTLHPVEWDGAERISGREGPYPVTDPAIQTRAAVAEFILSADLPWTGFQVPLGDNAGALETAQELLVPLRFHETTVGSGTNVQVWIQIGRLSEEGGGGAEVGSPVISKKIFDTTTDGLPPTGWSLRRINLNDGDRRRLGQARFLRILVLGTAVAVNTVHVEARLLIAPPIIVGSPFRAVVVGTDGIPTAAPDSSVSYVKATERPDPSLRAAYPQLINRLHGDGSAQRVLVVEWRDLVAGHGAGMDGRIARIPLENYRRLSFFFKGPRALDAAEAAALADGTLRFAVARGPDSLAPGRRNEEIALEADIPLSAFEVGRWSKVELHYGPGGESVSVDGRTIPGAQLIYRRGALTEAGGGSPSRSSYIALFISHPSGMLPNGTFSVDELLLEEGVPHYRGNFGAALRFRRPGTVLELGGAELISDGELNLAMESVLRGNPEFPSEQISSGILGRTAVSARVLGSTVRGNLSVSASDRVPTWSGGHGIDTPLGPLTLREEFSYDPVDERLHHQFGVDLTSPFATSLKASLDKEGEILTRAWTGNMNLGKTWIFQGNINTRWTETPMEHPPLPPSYGGAWIWSWPPLIPDTGKDARLRDSGVGLRGGLEGKPLGFLVSANGKSLFNSTRQTIGSEALGMIEIPFERDGWKGRLMNSRAIRRVGNNPGASLREDGLQLWETISDFEPLITQIPVYPLLDTEFKEIFMETLAETTTDGTMENAAFVETFALELSLPLQKGPSALYIPSGFQGKVERTLERSFDTTTDSGSISIGMDFTALNLFGAFGQRPLFSFYRNDEFSHRVEGDVNFLEDGNTRWRLLARQTLGFFGFQGAQLEMTNTYILSTSGWSDALALVWTVPTRNSLLSALYDRAMGALGGRRSWPALSALAEMETQRFRRQILELTLDFTGEGATKILVGHESIVRIAGRLGLSTFGNLSMQWAAETDTTTILVTAGATLHLTY